MFSMILSAAVIGVEAKVVQVEADVCDGRRQTGYGRLCGIRESPFRQNG